MIFSFSSIAGMAFTAMISIGIPVVALLWLRRKTGHAVRAALVGLLCFVVFALVLEPMLHMLVLPKIMHLPWLYVAYGCLAAGLFEETGRLVGLAFLCKKNPRVATGAAYGIGHGGGEAILLAGIVSLAQLSLVLTYSSNSPSVAVQQTAELLRRVPPYQFWIGGVERISAMALHFALSILIWMVVTKRVRVYWYFAAIGLHALTNVSAAMYQTGLLTNLVLVEVIVFACAAGTCALVGALYVRTRHNAPSLTGEAKEKAMDAPYAPVQTAPCGEVAAFAPVQSVQGAEPTSGETAAASDAQAAEAKPVDETAPSEVPLV